LDNYRRAKENASEVMSLRDKIEKA